jgi:hypothetical protein
MQRLQQLLLALTVVYLLEGVKAVSRAAATRRFAAHPEEAFPLFLSLKGNSPGRSTALSCSFPEACPV